MKLVIQRVLNASVKIDNEIYSSIDKGLLVLAGFKYNDDEKIYDWIINKLVNLRIFEDENDKMNLSVKDINGEILIVPNFTLYGNAKKGFRPSYTDAAKPDEAAVLFENFCNKISKSDISTKFGKFGAMMEVSLTNDGPVTIILEKENPE